MKVQNATILTLSLEDMALKRGALMKGFFHFCCNFFIWHHLNIEGGCQKGAGLAVGWETNGNSGGVEGVGAVYVCLA